ncbi:hypothetical protein KIW84_058195 [Lathyrus oleraceus]|uniref:beta-galactosidase n=1 Tax=Pisum sativum TaxID=3888 RepID=A0A9D4X4B2_PEA|nr:hypothetical protein KIW84_058195 [Pisum sativum]
MKFLFHMIIKLSPLMDKEGYYFMAPFITPEVLLRCDTDLIQKAKEGGLDVIQTYVFWNGHEPSPGKYYFEGNHDLVKFIKLVQQAGLYVHLRIGPYACAEWNFGGFPVWLNITNLAKASQMQPAIKPARMELQVRMPIAIKSYVESVSPLSLPDRLKSGWNVEKRIMSDESLTKKTEEARINAEEVSALAAAAVNHSMGSYQKQNPAAPHQVRRQTSTMLQIVPAGNQCLDVQNHNILQPIQHQSVHDQIGRACSKNRSESASYFKNAWKSFSFPVVPCSISSQFKNLSKSALTSTIPLLPNPNSDKSVCNKSNAKRDTQRIIQPYLSDISDYLHTNPAAKQQSNRERKFHSWWK